MIAAPFLSGLWCHRLIRADINLTSHEIQFHALRRKDPLNHLLLGKHPYEPPTKRCHE